MDRYYSPQREAEARETAMAERLTFTVTVTTYNSHHQNSDASDFPDWLTRQVECMPGVSVTVIPEQDLIDYRHHPDWTAPATDAGDHADVEVNP